MLSINDIYAAAERIKGHVTRTPTIACQSLSKRVGANLTLKLENLQSVGSFKERGAANRLALLTEEEKNRGVITVSAGNHAQGVARHSQLMGIDAIIVMPKFTPVAKVNRTAAWGARIILEGDDFAQASLFADELAAKEGRIFVHPYDDPAVMAGQGTAALEIFEDAGEFDYLLVPVGGGGLIAGFAIAAAALRPYTKVIGVQSEQFFSYSMTQNKDLPVLGGATIAEGTAVRKLGHYPFEVIKKHVHDIISVPEQAIEDAITLTAEHAKQVTEGSGANALAAILTYPERFKNKNIAFPISGANIDTRILANTLLRTLLREGRLLRLRFFIPDRPGVLADISHIIGIELNGNIIEVSHQRLFTTSSVQSAVLEIMIEARSAEHSQEIVECLQAKYKVERV
ncbi:threonine ammonia-lyase [Commensalibacter nepenthis]|uniref:L-threonine dehydratase catabolic TdcB n=1 Tax=Commensalibacter nepenthis TaxID=3043872 RepID=A0ABT6Q665_9PROT|nr:threonine ammonia-lyase [Commensalibacter sp. TBRC 10068]MDI2112386.1 threonine ammonia-lyase [Commensalibacter sp. TBRC 10068]